MLNHSIRLLIHAPQIRGFPFHLQVIIYILWFKRYPTCLRQRWEPNNTSVHQRQKTTSINFLWVRSPKTPQIPERWEKAIALSRLVTMLRAIALYSQKTVIADLPDQPKTFHWTTWRSFAHICHPPIANPGFTQNLSLLLASNKFRTYGKPNLSAKVNTKLRVCVLIFCKR